MCIAVFKPKGVDLPSVDTLENCFINNEDGAGFSYNDNGKVITKKGLMTWEEFKSALDSVKNPKDRGMILHFRITTHGGTNKENTHPFPVTNNMKLMGSPSSKSDLVMAHNGIISSVTVPYTSKYSDTMLFIQNQVSLMHELDPKFYLNEKFQKLLGNLAGSKLVFLDGEGTGVIIGDFNVFEGCHFSNYTYKEYSRGYYDYSSRGYGSTSTVSKESHFSMYLKDLPTNAIIKDIKNNKTSDNRYYEYMISGADVIYYYELEDKLVYITPFTCENYKYANIKQAGTLYKVGRDVERPYWAKVLYDYKLEDNGTPLGNQLEKVFIANKGGVISPLISYAGEVIEDEDNEDSTDDIIEFDVDRVVAWYEADFLNNFLCATFNLDEEPSLTGESIKQILREEPYILKELVEMMEEEIEDIRKSTKI